MTDDTKLDFYLKHRAQIEEWAALRPHAQTLLDQSLLAAAEQTAADGETPTPEFETASNYRWVRLRIPQAETQPSWIELNWSPKSLLKGAGGDAWPALIVCATPDAGSRPIRERITEATRPFRGDHGLNEESAGWWVWYGRLRPEKEPIAIDDYVEYCIGRFRSTWLDLHDVIRSALRGTRPGSRVPPSTTQ